MAIILAFLPLVAKLGLWFLGKFIADEQKRIALEQQWKDTLRDISNGVADSANLGLKDAAARKRLDDKFNKMKGTL